jgi:predicted kinase
MLCGKIAAGKSTLTTALGDAPDTIVISEDFWLARLYREEMRSVADYIDFSGRLKAAMGPHIEALLKTGLSVVLDFPANTPSSRAWMRGLFERAGADHRLHFLDTPDEVCRRRLRARNAAGAHEFAAGDAEFDIITSYFRAPDETEGFHVIRYRSE